jgi:sulfur-oxidizing protein SoxZ
MREDKMARTLLTVPPTARRGEVVELKALIAHPMETGYRPDDAGKLMPRNIIRRFACHYNGERVFSAELYPAISANPYLAFHVRAAETGPLTFTWEGDNGFTQQETVMLNVA